MARMKLFALLPAALAAACAVGPDYVPPVPTAPTLAAANAAPVTGEPFDAAWWEQFGDPVLDELVERSLEGDLDLAIAAARVTEARAYLAGARRDLWPGAAVDASRSERHAQQPGFGSGRLRIDSYEVGPSMFWELDLFGRVRRGVEASAADADAALADLRDAQVLVAAEVARTYVELRGAQKRSSVARANLDNQRETLELTRVRLELGRGSELDVASAEARLKATEASIPPLAADEAIAAHRLAVLVGLAPSELDIDLSPRDIPSKLTTLAVDTPASLLRRRPDVRAAERALAAATARIGVARAELFPRLSLAGFIGFIAGDASELGESSSRAWSVTPALSWGGFDPGVRARVLAAEARAEGALATYERTVLRAVEETESALVSYTQESRRLTAVIDQANASRRAAELARIQYREGALDFLRLLDAERTVLEAEDAVASAETSLNASVVAIYRALGGGWEGTI